MAALSANASFVIFIDLWTWAVDATGLIITSGTCCGQEAQYVNDTSGGRSGTQSCWWVVDQTCIDRSIDWRLMD